ncbi:unnamed protein product [Albugo candida]|uniref:Calcineurin-like phosphoesterase domain-containing protein n=1 Tax=Albugo candida TaxID=65357 RepID=A0A024GCW8_9STRA|nr:unnamed protein product [Albugo candida]|eukprot:CCI44362.1 unnamed protein product [Albugo candida]
MYTRKLLLVIGITIAAAIIITIIAVVVRNDDDSTKTTDRIAPSDHVSEADLLEKPDKSSPKLSKQPKSIPDTGLTLTMYKTLVLLLTLFEARSAFTMLAIGDWGATTYKPGSCCSKYRKTTEDSIEYKTDYWAQINVAEILSQVATEIKPVRIINHGDNAYWNGVGPKDVQNRMENTYESIYNQPSLRDIPWISVIGNHDLGGSEFICGDEDYSFRECESVEELKKYLNLKFSLQQTYKSPNNNRWQLRDHYYVERFEKGGVSVEIYNIDTNKADSHGLRQICCQCYGYVRNVESAEDKQKALEKSCSAQTRGSKLCAGGSTELYDACATIITQWWDISLREIQKDLSRSNATWKVVNSHYSPHFHMSEENMKTWYGVTKAGNVHLWLNGHTHGFNHDVSNWGTNFIENGGGGGIQSETSGKPPANAERLIVNKWIAPGNPYGFFELYFSEEWLTVQFVTFDDRWVFSTQLEEIKIGGHSRNYCWHIPVNLGEGRLCKNSKPFATKQQAV